MKIKYKKKVSYVMETYPKKCNECPCFHIVNNCRNMNEVYSVATCELGYMSGLDTRDFRGITRSPSCKIENDKRVSIYELD